MTGFQACIDLKYELASDSVTFEVVDFQDVYSCFVAGDTGTVPYCNPFQVIFTPPGNLYPFRKHVPFLEICTSKF